MSHAETTTVYEIGRRAGCSVATVSRVLNNSGAVSAHKRHAILQAIRDTEYFTTRARKANRRAARPKAETSVVEIIVHRSSPIESVSVQHGRMTVGPLEAVHPLPHLPSFLVPTNVFYRRLMDAALEELTRSGCRTLIQMNSDLLDTRIIADINRPDRSGVLLLGEYSAKLTQFIDRCIHPLVLVDIISGGKPDVVTTDNFAGIQQAFEHIYGLGHREIGFVGRRDDVAAFRERFTAYRLQMADAGLSIHPEWIYQGPDHIELAADAVRQILERPERPTAFMCSNDVYALGVVRAATRAGISIPKELSVIGFDDVDSASLITPSLSTVRVPVYEMGRQAVQQLLMQIHSGMPPKSRGCQVRMIPELIVRESTAAPGAQ